MGSLPKVAIITTSRSDWVSVAPIAKAIDKDSTFDMALIVGGYHFVRELGYSFSDIQSQSLSKVKKVITDPRDYKKMSVFCNKIQKQMLKALTTIKPNLVIIIGDRLEQLECAIAARVTDCVIVHLCGGDISGNLDNMFRYAISELADYHFVKTDQSKERLVQRGFNKLRVKVIGLPAFDYIKNMENKINKNQLKKYFSLKPYEYILILFNPDSYDNKVSFSRMKKILDELKPIPNKKVIIYPNGDEGSAGIIKAINIICKKLKDYMSYKSISPEKFILLEKYASLMIGNSSSALWEAPVFGTPVINLGTRQNKREALFGVVTLQEFKEICKAVKKCLDISLNERVKIAQKSRQYVKFGKSSALAVKFMKEICKKEVKNVNLKKTNT